MAREDILCHLKPVVYHITGTKVISDLEAQSVEQFSVTSLYRNQLMADY